MSAAAMGSRTNDGWTSLLAASQHGRQDIRMQFLVPIVNHFVAANACTYSAVNSAARKVRRRRRWSVVPANNPQTRHVIPWYEKQSAFLDFDSTTLPLREYKRYRL